MKRRNSVPAAWIEEASETARKALTSVPEFQRAVSLALFVPHLGEVQIGPLMEELIGKKSRRICVPAHDEVQDRYRFCWIGSATVWSDGPHGIPQPNSMEWVTDASLDVIIIPCVGYDAKGRRLGHGQGHYDRILARFGGCRMGLAFSFQEVDALPEAEHDQKMDVIVTEKGINRC